MIWCCISILTTVAAMFAAICWYDEATCRQQLESELAEARQELIDLHGEIRQRELGYHIASRRPAPPAWHRRGGLN